MFPNLAALLFMSRAYGHMAHLASNSYAQHMALDGFYNDLVGLSDTLIESYQGRNGLVVIPDMPVKGDVNNPTAVLREHLKLIEGVRYTAVDKGDAPLQSLVDNICVLYLQTLYKLEQLK